MFECCFEALKRCIRPQNYRKIRNDHSEAHEITSHDFKENEALNKSLDTTIEMCPSLTVSPLKEVASVFPEIASNNSRTSSEKNNEIITSSKSDMSATSSININDGFCEEEALVPTNEKEATLHSLMILNSDNALKELIAVAERESITEEKIYEYLDNGEKMEIYFSPPTKGKSLVVICKFEADCSPKEFIEFVKNPEETKILFENIENLVLMHNFQDIELFHVTYKKMPLADPRDFVYIRHQRRLDEEGLRWVDCLKSIDSGLPEEKGFVRADLKLQGNYVSAILDENKNVKRCSILLYIEADFRLKIPIPGFVLKPFVKKEFSDFLFRCKKRVKDVYKR